MISRIYGIFDTKAAAYLPLFQAQTDAVAVRMFERAVHDKQTEIGNFPADYTLFKLGTLDTESGFIEPDQHPTALVTGAQLAAKGLQ